AALLQSSSSSPPIPPPPPSTLFPYTTLFRSPRDLAARSAGAARGPAADAPPDAAAAAARCRDRGPDPDAKPTPDHHGAGRSGDRSEEHTSELQSLTNLVCRLLLEKKKATHHTTGMLVLAASSVPTTTRRPRLQQHAPYAE